jgi:tetratricopeptide (TPR) repeat protein
MLLRQNLAIAANPKDGRTYAIRGCAYLHLKQHEKAIDDCTKAIDLGTPDVLAYVTRASSYGGQLVPRIGCGCNR